MPTQYCLRIALDKYPFRRRRLWAAALVGYPGPTRLAKPRDWPTSLPCGGLVVRPAVPTSRSPQQSRASSPVPPRRALCRLGARFLWRVLESRGPAIEAPYPALERLWPELRVRTNRGTMIGRLRALNGNPTPRFRWCCGWGTAQGHSQPSAIWLSGGRQKHPALGNMGANREPGPRADPLNRAQTEHSMGRAGRFRAVVDLT